MQNILNQELPSSWQMLTNQVIDSVQKGCAPWQKSLKSHELSLLRPKNYKSKKFYKGSNFVSLFYATLDAGYPTSLWLTPRQIAQMGEHIKSGERCYQVDCWLFYAYENAAGRVLKDRYGNVACGAYIKKHDIYNIAQTTIEPVFWLKDTEQKHDKIEQIIQNYGVKIRFGHELLLGKMPEAMYDASKHDIIIPDRKYFDSTGDYYSTLVHELAHSTAAALGRKSPQTDDEIAFEELVAELASFFLCSELNVDFNAKNSGSYIASWAKLLAQPETSILKASSLAQRAAQHLLSFAKAPKDTKSKDLARNIA